MSQSEFPSELHIRPRATTTVNLRIPTYPLETLEHVAASRDVSVEALLKLYVGQGLRQDASWQTLAKSLSLFSEDFMEERNQPPAQERASTLE